MKMQGKHGSSQHTFAASPQASIPRSQFNRSHGCKTTFDAGYLVPIFVDEALPGDTFNLKMTAFGRLATPVFPIMDNLYMDTFFFAVPVRLVWDNWQKFNGEQVDPADSTDYTVPTCPGVATTGYLNGSLSDYLGIPTEIADLEHSNLWHRAYNLIWNEWFRDENLQDSVVVDTDDGPDVNTDYVLLQRGKRHDYFTSCLPWPQKINDASTLNLPLGGTAPVVSTDSVPLFYKQGNPGTEGAIAIPTGANPNTYWAQTSATGSLSAVFGTVTGLEADLSQATAVTINELREAFQIQKLFERDARGGTRYVEIIRSHFGITSPDARLQRPEFLGGGVSNINVSPVAQTSETGTTAQGNLAAYGTLITSKQGFTKSFTEHCLLLGMAVVRADLNYQEGLNRMFSRSTRYDYYWPALSHIGEQAVLNKEIYADGSAADDNVFGYQERYAEYRYKPSQVTGQFRSNYTTSLDAWHLAQEFGSLPSLNAAFIVENPPVDRVIADATDPHLILDCYFDLKCARPMPVYSIPGLIDHF